MINKKVVGFVFLGLMFFSLVAFVSAESIADKFLVTVEKVDSDSFFFGDTADSPTLAKFLIFLLVTLIVYSILKVTPMFKDKAHAKGHPIVTAAISIIIGILAVFFLRSEEIYAILLSYGALGITLSGIIPFILIAVFTTELTKKHYGFLAKIIWGIFGIVLLYRWFTADNIGAFGAWVYPLLIFMALIMFIWEKTFVGMILKEEYVSRVDKFKRDIKAQRVKRETEAADITGD